MRCCAIIPERDVTRVPAKPHGESRLGHLLEKDLQQVLAELGINEEEIELQRMSFQP